MNGCVMLVTGSTDGIGKETALELAKGGAEVIVHGRRVERCEQTTNELREATGNEKIAYVTADFSDLQQVRAMAAEVQRRWGRLHVLINNAGVFMPERVLTPAGLETTFVVNHLAHFLLTNLLIDLLKRSAPSRIITVSSITHQRANIDFDNLQGEERYDGYNAYALSKLANILFTYELAERLAGTGVTANCLHPGVINTKLLESGFGTIGASVEEGAATSVYLASSPEGAKVSGKYFVHEQQAASSWLSRDKTLRRKLWEVSEQLVGGL